MLVWPRSAAAQPCCCAIVSSIRPPPQAHGMREKDPNYVPGAPATAARPPAVGTAAGAAMEALPTGLAVRPFQTSSFRVAFHFQVNCTGRRHEGTAHRARGASLSHRCLSLGVHRHASAVLLWLNLLDALIWCTRLAAAACGANLSLWGMSVRIG